MSVVTQQSSAETSVKGGAKHEKAIEELAKMEKALWIVLCTLFVAIVTLVIVASANAPIEGILTVAAICGVLSIAFSVIANAIGSHKKKYAIVDEASSTTVSMTSNDSKVGSRSKDGKPRIVKINPQNPSLAQNKAIDVVALDGTAEVV